MKIKGVKIHVSPAVIIVFVFFVLLFVWSFFLTNDYSYIYWGLPLCLCLLIIPAVSSYSLGGQYIKLLAKQCSRVHIGHSCSHKSVILRVYRTLVSSLLAF